MIIVPTNKTPELVTLCSTKNLDSLPKIKERIVSLVEFYGRLSGAYALRELNRRFGRLLRPHGRTMSEVALELANEGLVLMKSVDHRIWLLSPSLNKMAEMLADEEKPAMQLEHEIGMQWITRSSSKESIL